MGLTIHRAERAILRAGLRYQRACEAQQRAVTAGSSEGMVPFVLAIFDRKVEEARAVVDAAYVALVAARAADPQAAAEDAGEAEIIAQGGYAAVRS